MQPLTRRPRRRLILAAAVGAALCAVNTSTGQILFEDRKLTASDEPGGVEFGRSAALSGHTAVVGAPFDDSAGPLSGAAYVFDVVTGQQLFKLTASDSPQFAYFGEAVSISGAMAIVGAYGDDSSAGSAYVFDTTTGQQLFKLTASDGASGAFFGRSVSISGSTALIGADGSDIGGAAYIFDLVTGQQLLKITGSDTSANDGFGRSVAISGTTAIVGAANHSGGGAAYIFDASTGQQLFKLSASDTIAGDGFGGQVAISGDTAVIAAVGDDHAGFLSGSAYVFDALTGQQIGKLTANDASERDEFGSSVSISGANAVVGAAGDVDAGFDSGSAYVFDTATGQQLFKLAASDGAADDRFGSSVAISGAIALSGATGDANFAGSAYVFPLTAACPGDIADDFGSLGADGMVSFGDFLALLGLVGPCPATPECPGDIADDFGTLGGDGQVSFGDFLALLGLVGPCP